MLKKIKIPKDIKPLLWSYKFSKIDPIKNKQIIIISIINYGNWEQWKWLIKIYGKQNLKKIIVNIPKSAFFERPVELISLLLGIKKFKYASRSDYIKAKRDI